MKKTVLIVDDDAPIRESLRKVLEAEGYEAVLAADGQEGLERFDPERIDLLLLDLNLPARSGWDLFERITSINPLLPIIMITGRDNQWELASAAGVGALMEKPLDVPFLLQTMTALLAEPAEVRLNRVAGFDSPAHYGAPRRPTSAVYHYVASQPVAGTQWKPLKMKRRGR
jgi:DNA-binding response OmpR family regulator